MVVQPEPAYFRSLAFSLGSFSRDSWVTEQLLLLGSVCPLFDLATEPARECCLETWLLSAVKWALSVQVPVDKYLVINCNFISIIRLYCSCQGCDKLKNKPPYFLLLSFIIIPLLSHDPPTPYPSI